METSPSNAGYAWYPDEVTIRDANWTRFVQYAGTGDYDTLLKRSADEPEWFWNTLISYLDYRFYVPYDKVVDYSDGPEFPRWCVGGRTNLVLNALDRKTPEERKCLAVVWEGEDGEVRQWTYDELDTATSRCAAGLAKLGIKTGDVVGLYMPPLPETVAAYLAIVKIGAIVLPLFSGFGPDALAARLNDGGAVAVITVDATLRRGQPIAMKTVLDETAPQVPTLRHLVVVNRLGQDIPMQAGRDIGWDELTAGQPDRWPTAEVDAEHPLMVIYTSGTTGKPKGIVHTHCGLPIKIAQDTQLSWDYKPTDRVLYMADFGWLAGPMATIGCTLANACFVMAEGAPDYPEPCRYWRIAQDQRATIIGLAPTLARGLRRHGDAETDRYDLSSLRLVITSGEPCDNDTWEWIFRHVARGKAPVMNLSGGTEIGGGIVSTNVLFPIKPGGFHGSIPGTGADIVDAAGNPVGPGEIGELVMRQMSIGLTRGIWKDRQRYLDSYWSQIPGLWVQGDLASRDTDGSWTLHGRSDDTLKVSGKRTGPAEIEAILLATHAVSDAAVVGVPDTVKGSAVVCVVIAAPGQTAGDELGRLLSAAVTENMGSSFRPKQVLFVRDLPRTRNMKVMRRVVRSVLTGQPAGDLSSLVNPETVDELRRQATDLARV